MESWLAIIIRCASVYIFMLMAFRVAGKKELSQLNTSDVVLILLISNAVQNAMVGENTSLWGGLLAAAVLFCLNYLLKYILFKNQKVRRFLNQEPLVLIHQGQLNFDNLSKLAISHDELLQAVREHGLEDFKNVKWAIFESDGNISVISGDEHLRHTHFKRKHAHQAINLSS